MADIGSGNEIIDVTVIVKGGNDDAAAISTLWAIADLPSQNLFGANTSTAKIVKGFL